MAAKDNRLAINVPVTLDTSEFVPVVKEVVEAVGELKAEVGKDGATVLTIAIDPKIENAEQVKETLKAFINGILAQSEQLGKIDLGSISESIKQLGDTLSAITSGDAALKKWGEYRVALENLATAATELRTAFSNIELGFKEDETDQTAVRNIIESLNKLREDAKDPIDVNLNIELDEQKTESVASLLNSLKEDFQRIDAEIVPKITTTAYNELESQLEKIEQRIRITAQYFGQVYEELQPLKELSEETDYTSLKSALNSGGKYHKRRTGNIVPVEISYDESKLAELSEKLQKLRDDYKEINTNVNILYNKEQYDETIKKLNELKQTGATITLDIVGETRTLNRILDQLMLNIQISPKDYTTVNEQLENLHEKVKAIVRSFKLDSSAFNSEITEVKRATKEVEDKKAKVEFEADATQFMEVATKVEALIEKITSTNNEGIHLAVESRSYNNTQATLNTIDNHIASITEAGKAIKLSIDSETKAGIIADFVEIAQSTSDTFVANWKSALETVSALIKEAVDSSKQSGGGKSNNDLTSKIAKAVTDVKEKSNNQVPVKFVPDVSEYNATREEIDGSSATVNVNFVPGSSLDDIQTKIQDIKELAKEPAELNIQKTIAESILDAVEAQIRRIIEAVTKPHNINVVTSVNTKPYDDAEEKIIKGVPPVIVDFEINKGSTEITSLERIATAIKEIKSGIEYIKLNSNVAIDLKTDDTDINNLDNIRTGLDEIRQAKENGIPISLDEQKYAEVINNLEALKTKYSEMKDMIFYPVIQQGVFEGLQQQFDSLSTVVSRSFMDKWTKAIEDVEAKILKLVLNSNKITQAITFTGDFYSKDIETKISSFVTNIEQDKKYHISLLAALNEDSEKQILSDLNILSDNATAKVKKILVHPELDKKKYAITKDSLRLVKDINELLARTNGIVIPVTTEGQKNAEQLIESLNKATDKANNKIASVFKKTDFDAIEKSTGKIDTNLSGVREKFNEIFDSFEKYRTPIAEIAEHLKTIAEATSSIKKSGAVVKVNYDNGTGKTTSNVSEKAQKEYDKIVNKIEKTLTDKGLWGKYEENQNEAVTRVADRLKRIDLVFKNSANRSAETLKNYSSLVNETISELNKAEKQAATINKTIEDIDNNTINNTKILNDDGTITEKYEQYRDQIEDIFKSLSSTRSELLALDDVSEETTNKLVQDATQSIATLKNIIAQADAAAKAEAELEKKTGRLGANIKKFMDDKDLWKVYSSNITDNLTESEKAMRQFATNMVSLYQNVAVGAIKSEDQLLEYTNKFEEAKNKFETMAAQAKEVGMMLTNIGSISSKSGKYIDEAGQVKVDFKAYEQGILGIIARTDELKERIHKIDQADDKAMANARSDVINLNNDLVNLIDTITKGQKELEANTARAEKLNQSIIGTLNTKDAQDFIKEGTQVYKTNVKEIKEALKDLIKISIELNNPAGLSKERLDELNNKYKEINKTLKELFKTAVTNPPKKGQSLIGINIKDIEEAKKALQDFLNTEQKVKNFDLEIGSTNAKGVTKLTASWKDQNGIIKTLTTNYDKATGALTGFGIAEKNAFTFTERLSLAFKRQSANLIASLGTVVSFYRVMESFRQGITIVRDIDTAMTELRKVSEATEAQLASFEKQSFELGRQVGATGKDIINSAADWSRLGYTIDEVGELARVTSIYMNVADGLDSVDVASEHLISTLKAFNIEAEDAIGVADRFNKIGNEFALSADDVGEALKRSASALVAANNSVDESVALIAGMNEIVQNAESTGTALRTISLRIRNTRSTLAELGEESEGAAETTAKLREQVMALAGVDILTPDTEAYKSTYEILREISKVWKDMNDLDQAALLELLAGKNRANSLAALLNNFSQAEAALEASTNASGSALQENQRYLDSIQGKLSQLTASWQEMWNNAIDNDFIKFLIDVANRLVQIIDKIGPINALFSVLAGIFSNRIAKFVLDGGGIFGKMVAQISAARQEIAAFSASLQSLKMTDVNITPAAFGLLGSGLSTKIDKKIVSNNIAGLSAISDILNTGKDATPAQIAAIDGIAEALQGPLKSALNSAKDSTEKFNAVQKLLGTQMKISGAEAALMATKMIGVQLAVTAATYVLTTAISKWKAYNAEKKRQAEETNRQTIEEGKQSQAILKSAQAYEKAKETYASDPQKELEYRDAVKDVVTSLGDKAKALEDLNENSQEYLLMLDRLIQKEKEQAAQVAANALASAEATAKAGLKDAEYKSFTLQDTYTGDSLSRIRSLPGLDETLIQTVGIRLKIDPNDIDKSIEQLQSVREWLKILEEDAEKTGKKVSDYKDYNSLIAMRTTLEQNLIPVIEAQINKYEALSDARGETPTDAQSYQNWLNNLYNEYTVQSDLQGLYEEYAEKYYPKLAMELEEQTRLTEKLTASRVKDNEELAKAVEEYSRLKNTPDVDEERLQNAFDKVAEAAEKAGVSMNEALSLDISDKVKLTADEIEQLTQKLEKAGHTTMANTMLEDTDFMLNKNIDSVEEFIQTLDEYIAELNKAANKGRDFVDQVNAQAEAIDKLQETYSSVKGIVEATFSGSMDNSSYLDALQTLATQISELGDKGEDARDKLNAMFANLEYGNLHQLGDLAEQVATQQMAKFWEEFEKNGVTLSPAVKDAITQMTVMEEKLKGATTGLQNIASAYNTVASAIDDFNENGVITLSNLTSLLSLEPQYLAMLDIENGKLVMNEQVMKSLVQARIDDAKAATYESAAAEINAIVVAAEARAQGEAALAAEDSAQASNDAAIQAANVANTMGAAISPIAQYTRALSDARKVEGMTSDEEAEIRTIRERTEETIRILDNVGNNITTGSKKTRDTVMGHTNDAAKNAEDKAKKAADTIKSTIDSIIAKWKKALDAGGISYKQYISNIEQISNRYRSQLSKEDYDEYQLQALEARKEMYEKAANAAQNYINRQKEGLQDQVDALDKQSELLEEQQDKIEKHYDKLIEPLEARTKELEKQKKAIEKEIESIEEGYEKMLEPLQKQLKTLQDQAEAVQDLIDGINKYFDSIVTPLNRQIEDIERSKKMMEEVLEDINEKYDDLIKPYNDQIEDQNLQIKQIQKVIKERNKEIEAIEEKFNKEIEANNEIIKGYQKIQKEIQKTIKEYEKEIEAIEARMKPYQDQQEIYNEQIHVLQDEQRVNNKMIRDLERLKDAQEQFVKPLQEQLDLLNKANDNRQKEMDLMRAKYNLERALNQKTKRVYTGGQFEYRVDNSAVRDAQNNLNDLMSAAEVSSLEEAIKRLQEPIDEIDKKIAELQRKNTLIGYDISDIEDEVHALDHALEPFEKQMDAVNEKIQQAQKEVELWGERIDELNEKNERINEQMESLIKPIQEVVKGLEKQIERHEEEVEKLEAIIDGYERAREAESKYFEEAIAGYDKQLRSLNRQVGGLEYLRTVQLRGHTDYLNNLNEEIKAVERSIKPIEEQRDAILDAKQKEVNAIDKVIEGISDEIEKYEEARDKETKAIQAQIEALDGQKKVIQEQIAALEEYAQKWQKVMDKWQQIQDENILAEVLGRDWKAVLDSLDPKPVEDFGNAYINICEQIARKTSEMAGNVEQAVNTIKGALAELDDAASGAKGAMDDATTGIIDYGDAAEELPERTKKTKLDLDEIRGSEMLGGFKAVAKSAGDAAEKIELSGTNANLANPNLQTLGNKLKVINTNGSGAATNLGRIVTPLGSLNVQTKNDALIIKGPEGIKAFKENSGSIVQPMKQIASSLVSTNVQTKTDSVLSNMIKLITTNISDKTKSFLENISGKIGTTTNSSGFSHSSGKITHGTLISIKEKGGRVEIPTAAKGRRITANDIFDDIAKMVGEDTMVAAKVGEGIFTKRQTDDLEEFIQLTPSLIQSTKELQNIAKIFEAQLDHSNFLPTSVQNYIASAIQQSDKTAQGLAASTVNNTNNLNFTVGDITIQHAENASDLARQIKNNFPTAAYQAFMSV